MEDTKSLLTRTSDSQKLLLDQLPKYENYWDYLDLFQWEGFWFAPTHLVAGKAFHEHFQARDDDVILASPMKTGTTWLKALCFCISSRCDEEEEEEDPLVKNHPAFYVQTIETQTYTTNPLPDLSCLPSPRLFHTHLPYSVLPDSIKESKCKIVFIARNPMDTLVSMWHFFNTVKKEPYPFDKAFEDFCNGLHPAGPFFDLVLQYWKESLKMPDKVLFLRYEDLKREPKVQLKKLAAFIGRPFVKEEEIDKVLWRCSLERLKNLEVNKNGVDPWIGMPNKAFFRLGAVGDWKNYFTPEMKHRLDQIAAVKLQGSGLQLDI